ncbi:MAG TPA: ankyrin repeat domain-containing protein [Baekduia sp.]|uniref:ankyrin repeat domain-containing protein n=1 Tax=Baekduia sp. TaxID=2600305 RepID=UPI002C6A95C6|nr:ankyrin repeat domain-containing protein [Baekduia sp.]HMJ35669.1 ankyrin repeat domain-containing protein [Baekduia sp.]
MAALTLTELHRQAKELERAHRRGDAAALARAAPFRPDPAKPLKDAGAQMVVAREHGFPSWVRLRAYVERIDAFGEGLEYAFRTDLEYYEGRADGLLASAQDGTPSAEAAFEGTGAALTREGARQVVAGRHGFASWAALRRHVEALADGGEPFARAFRAMEAGDRHQLAALLARFPELARARGTNGNALINMASDVPTAALLLEHGADVAHPNAHGWTPLHQAAYADAADAAAFLLEHGAPPDVSGRGAGGTPLVVALFWGHHRVTDVLAAASLHPRNLRVAAGLGRVGLIEELVTPDGTVSEAAGALRGFYRPHGGFPAWTPSDDPQEILDEALAWAARSDRVEAISALVARGARVDADVYRGTPLVWAAATGRADAVRRLIELGADVDGRATFGGPTHGDGVTALHLAAQSGSLPTIEALLDAGADPTLRDTLHDSPAAGWADFGGHPEAAALLRSRGG